MLHRHRGGGCMTSEALAFAVAAVVLGCLGLMVVLMKRGRDRKTADREDRAPMTETRQGRRRDLLAISEVAGATDGLQSKVAPSDARPPVEATDGFAGTADAQCASDFEGASDKGAGDTGAGSQEAGDGKTIGQETDHRENGDGVAALVERFEGELEIAFDSFLASGGSLEEIEAVVSRYEIALGLAVAQGAAAGQDRETAALSNPVDCKGLSEALEWTRLWIAGQKRAS